MQANSTYIKVNHILSLVSDSTINLNKSDLAEHILENNLGPFFYYRRDTDGSIQQFPCNQLTILEKIDFCFDLDLLENESNCTLTDSYGKDAVDPSKNYGLVLKQTILNYFENKKIEWSDITSAIDSLDLPGPEEIYNDIKPSIDKNRFRSCLYLLSQCGKDIDKHALNGIILKIYQVNEE